MIQNFSLIITSILFFDNIFKPYQYKTVFKQHNSESH